MPISFRRATAQDNLATYTIFRASIADFGQRAGVAVFTGGNDPEHLASLWDRRRSLWEHLSRSSDQYWIAEAEDGKPIGYARSIVRDDHRELTEFFVLPGSQAVGVGRELLARAFPHDTAHRMIIATPDLPAMASYLKAGVYPVTAILYFNRAPEHVPFDSDLTFEAVEDYDRVQPIIDEIDEAILGFRREVDHQFLRQNRRLYCYKRHERVLGYGYVSNEYSGPFALVERRDFPAVLAHAETYAHSIDSSSIGLEVPATNTTAIDYLLQRGYRLEGFVCSLMANAPFGQLGHYIGASPLFFL